MFSARLVPVLLQESNESRFSLELPGSPQWKTFQSLSGSFSRFSGMQIHERGWVESDGCFDCPPGAGYGVTPVTADRNVVGFKPMHDSGGLPLNCTENNVEIKKHGAFTLVPSKNLALQKASLLALERLTTVPYLPESSAVNTNGALETSEADAPTKAVVTSTTSWTQNPVRANIKTVAKARRGVSRRAVFSDLQRQRLEDRFQIQKYISKPDRKKLAEVLGLKDSQVKVWFQNRRMKWRNCQEREMLSSRSRYKTRESYQDARKYLLQD